MPRLCEEDAEGVEREGGRGEAATWAGNGWGQWEVFVKWVQGSQPWGEKGARKRKPPPPLAGHMGYSIPDQHSSRLSWEKPICPLHEGHTCQILSRVQAFLDGQRCSWVCSS